jgi:hypothetical protein
MTTIPPSIATGTAELASIAWDELSGTDALTATVAVARLKAVVDGALVQAAQRLEATGVTEAIGWASTRDFLTHLLGGHKGAGGAYVRLAERTSALPQVRDALSTGEISMAQATAITRRTATLPNLLELRQQAADKMLDLAAQRDYDATDLDKTFPDVVRELDPDGALLGNDLDLDKAERGAHHARHLSFRPDHLGGAWVKGYASLEEVETVKSVLMPLAAPVTTTPGACGGTPGNPDQGTRPVPCPDGFCAHDGRDTRDGGARMWDALVEACSRLQATDTLPRDHGTTVRMIVTTSYETLTGQLHSQGVFPSGDRLSAAAVRRLACDAEIIPGVLGAEGQILDVGRAHRLVTTALFLALVLRDQHCAFPGCQRLPLACDAHHIVHWADGGPTSLDNLVLLCRKHHTITHQTPWQVHLDPLTRRPVWTPPPPGTGPAWMHRPGQPRNDLVA